MSRTAPAGPRSATPSTSTTRRCATAPSARASATRSPTSWPSPACSTSSASGSSRAAGRARCPRTPSSSPGPRPASWSSSTPRWSRSARPARPASKASEDPQVRALLDARTPVVTLVAKSDRRHIERALRTDVAENCAMVRDTVALLAAEGRRVFLDAEHFFDGYALRPGHRAAGAGGRCRGGRRRGGAVRHQRRHAAAGHRRGGRPRWPRAPASASASTARTTPACAVANTVAAVQAGATHVQCTANGYGERPGNADLFAVVGNLVTKLGLPVLPDGALGELTRISHALAEIANIAPDTHQAYVGTSAFAHKAGLHASAIKVDPELYNHIDPVIVGNEHAGAGHRDGRPGQCRAQGRRARAGPGRPARRGVDRGGHGQGAGGARLVLRGRRRLAGAARCAARSARLAAPPFRLESYRVIIEHRAGRRGRRRGHRQGASSADERG